MLEAQLLIKLVRAQVYWEQNYGNDTDGVLELAMNMAVDTDWEDKIDDIIHDEFHETYEQLQARFLHNNYPDVTPEQLAQIGSTYHSLSWQYNAKIKEPTDAQKRMVGQWDDECRNADAQWRQHVSQGIDYMIGKLDNAIGDKIHRRNLQIADLKKQASRPDLTQQVVALANRIGRAGVMIADMERDLLAGDFAGGKILGDILAKRIEGIRKEMRGEKIPDGYCPPNSDIGKTP